MDGQGVTPLRGRLVTQNGQGLWCGLRPVPRAGSVDPGGTITTLPFGAVRGQARVTHTPPGLGPGPDFKLPPRPAVPTICWTTKTVHPAYLWVGTVLSPAHHQLTWCLALRPGGEPQLCR